ncbi:unnamed protein product [Rhodiola kirilowii]
MDCIYQNRQLQNSNWLPQKSHKSYWTREENKLFESALAIYDKNTADRWEKVAHMIPGRSVSDVINQYKELEDDVSDIEAGLVPTPGYLTSSFTLELGDDRDFDALRKKSARARSVDHEKKKGVPWTEDEHRSFLRGLIKHGKGDWKSISRSFVVSKTPTQVASHAQKYFLRMNSGLKDKRRPSIHDITTSNFTNAPLSDDSESQHLISFHPRKKKLHKIQYSTGINIIMTHQFRLLNLVMVTCSYHQLLMRICMALDSMLNLIIPCLKSNLHDNAFLDGKKMLHF